MVVVAAHAALVAAAVDPGGMGHLKLIAFEGDKLAHGLEVGIAGIEVARVVLLAIGYPALEHGCVALELVAHAHEQERGVVAVGIEQALQLIGEEGIAQAVLPYSSVFPVLREEGQFGLQIYAHFIGSGKGSLGRAPGVEAPVVEPILLTYAEDAQPVGLVHRGITREGEAAGVVLAAQVESAPIEQQPAIGSREVAEADAYLLGATALAEAVVYGEGVEVGRIFVPGLQCLVGGELQVEV